MAYAALAIKDNVFFCPPIRWTCKIHIHTHTVERHVPRITSFILTFFPDHQQGKIMKKEVRCSQPCTSQLNCPHFLTMLCFIPRRTIELQLRLKMWMTNLTTFVTWLSLISWSSAGIQWMAARIFYPSKCPNDSSIWMPWTKCSRSYPTQRAATTKHTGSHLTPSNSGTQDNQNDPRLF